MSGFTVNTTALMAGGQAISGHGSEAQSIQQQLTGAEVPVLAWGELGMMTGLYPAYLALLNDLQDHLQQMGVHLDKTGGLLTAAHQAYQEAEQGITSKLKAIGAGMASGATVAGPTGAVAGGLVGASGVTGKSALSSAPLAGSAYKAFQHGYSAVQAIGKGNVAEAGQAVAETGADVTGFAAEAVSIGIDPLNFLITKGLGFLEGILTPLKDALHLVTGDPDTLKNRAEKFNELAKTIKELADKVEQTALTSTQGWTGDAAPAAGQHIGETKQSIESTAGAAGHVASLLRISAVLMQAAYDIVNGIIAQVIEYLVVTWIAAMASSVFTFGGSDAAALGASAAEIGVGAEQAATKTAEATSLLGKILNVLKKIMDLLKKMKDTFMRAETTVKDASGVEHVTQEAGSGAKALAGDAKKGLEGIQAAAAKVSQRTGQTTVSQGQAWGQMVSDNIGHVVANAAKDKALGAVGLRKPEDSASTAEAVNTYAEDASHIAGILSGGYQAVDYSANPGGSGGQGQPPNSNSEGK